MTAGRTALAALDRALAARPHHDPDDLAEATRAAAALREELIRRNDRAALETVNAVVSLVLAARFPLGEPPWAAVEAGRDALRRVVEQEE